MPDETRPQTPRPRRAPNFVRFIATGAIVGFLIGAAIAWSGVIEDTTQLQRGYVYGTSDGVGIVGMLFAVIFAIVAAVIAVLLDRRGRA